MTEEAWLSAAAYMNQHQFAHSWNRNLLGRVGKAALAIMKSTGRTPVIETVPVKGGKKGTTREITTYPKSVLDQAFQEQRYLR